ncbi:hypothetical protein L1887_54217 [Cichorium endivia]|nr:hypothetical protein L1887_54217 [Cichorium endivia]
MAAPIACSQPWLPGSCRPSRIAFVMSRASSQSTPKRFSPSLSTVLTAVSHAHCSQAKVSTASRSRSTACKTSSYTPGCDAKLGAATRLAGVHDGVDEVAVGLLERLDRLPARAAHLLHDEVDVLGVDALLVDGRVVVLLLLFSLGLGSATGLRGLQRLGEQTLLRLGLSHLLSSLRLGELRHVLGLGLAEDNVHVRVRRLVHLGLGDHVEVLSRSSTEALVADILWTVERKRLRNADEKSSAGVFRSYSSDAVKDGDEASLTVSSDDGSAASALSGSRRSNQVGPLAPAGLTSCVQAVGRGQVCLCSRPFRPLLCTPSRASSSRFCLVSPGRLQLLYSDALNARFKLLVFAQPSSPQPPHPNSKC